MNQSIHKQISEISKIEPNLVFRSEKEIEKIDKQGGLIIRVAEGELTGFIICNKLIGKWTELGCLYVKPESRGQGIGSELFQKALEQSKNRKILIRTKESKLKQFFKDSGFKAVSLKFHPKFAFIYLFDRLRNLSKLNSFLKTINKESCVFVKG